MPFQIILQEDKLTLEYRLNYKINSNDNTTVQRNFPIRSTDHHRSHSEDVWA